MKGYFKEISVRNQLLWGKVVLFVVKDIEQKNSFFDLINYQLLCVPSYDLSYNIYLFPIGLWSDLLASPRAYKS